jgi:hypothetical protein
LAGGWPLLAGDVIYVEGQNVLEDLVNAAYSIRRAEIDQYPIHRNQRLGAQGRELKALGHRWLVLLLMRV